MCVKQSRTHGSLGNPEDFRNLCVRHTLYVKHGDDCSMLNRQLHHGFVQSLLKFCEIYLTSWGVCCRQVNQFFIILHICVQIIQAELKAATALFHEIYGHIDGNGMYPGVETGFAAKAVDGAICLGKYLKEEVVRIFVIRCHVVDQRVDARTIFLPEEVEGSSFAALSPANQRFVVGQILVVHGPLLCEIRMLNARIRKRLDSSATGFALQELLRQLVLGALECHLAMAVIAEMPFRFLVEKLMDTNTSAND